MIQHTVRGVQYNTFTIIIAALSLALDQHVSRTPRIRLGLGARCDVINELGRAAYERDRLDIKSLSPWSRRRRRRSRFHVFYFIFITRLVYALHSTNLYTPTPTRKPYRRPRVRALRLISRRKIVLQRVRLSYPTEANESRGRDNS